VVRLEADVHGETHLGVVIDDQDLLLGHGCDLVCSKWTG
jgi:hypothetical protein